MITFCIAFSINLIPAHADFYVDTLKVEYSKTSMGIAVTIPRFSWQMVSKDNQRGLMQEAYQIVAKDDAGYIILDTKKVQAFTSKGILYSGKPLKPTTRYDWTVIVWDESGKGFFTIYESPFLLEVIKE